METNYQRSNETSSIFDVLRILTVIVKLMGDRKHEEKLEKNVNNTIPTPKLRENLKIMGSEVYASFQQF